MEDLTQTNPKKDNRLKKKTPIIMTIGTAMESTVSTILWTQSFISYEKEQFVFNPRLHISHAFRSQESFPILSKGVVGLHNQRMEQ